MNRLLVITQKVDQDDQLLGFFISWLERLAKQFTQITILCLEQGAHGLPPNVKVISLGKDTGASKFAQLLRFYQNIAGLRREYDAVFVHMNPIWVVLGAIPWRIMRKRIVLWYTHKAVTLKLRIALWGANTVLTASPESFRIPSRKVVVTGHGVDTELFRPALERRSGRFSILTVGRIAPVKDYDVLVDALQILADERFDFTVTVVGSPALEEDRLYAHELKKRIEHSGLSKCISFVGKQPHADLLPYYQSHHLFVHMSRTGSLDKTILEAMACGMQVVSSNDAARPFLPDDMRFSEGHAAQLASRIKNLKGGPSRPELREYVVQHHDLNRLIALLAGIMIGSTS